MLYILWMFCLKISYKKGTVHNICIRLASISQYHVTNYIISRTDQGYSIRLTVDGSISNEDCKGCYLQIEVRL